ncbi:hypothetical protein [Streptomyces stelliscabiei]|uniref:hypothetical protein n=1 Tax=Streptomyces stelliscabiei TaxID=146820 RepID=UPI002FF09BEA
MGLDRKKESGDREGKPLPRRTSAVQSADAARFLGNCQVTPSSVRAVQRMAGNAAATAYVQRVTDADRDKANARRERWAARDTGRGGAQQAESFTSHETAFGPYNERPGRGGAPYISSNKKQYPGTQGDDRYVREEENQFTGLIPTLDAEQFLPLVEALKGRELSEEDIAGLSDEQCRAAAMLMGIANAEAVREPGAIKHIRSALRRQANPSHEAPEFLNDYPQGRIGGAQHERRVRSGRARRATPEVETILDASSSSDESTSRRR